MSVEVMGAGLSLPFGGNAKNVYIGLANHAGADGRGAHPSLDRLAAYACCDRSTVRRNLRWLEEVGVIVADGVGPHGTKNWFLPSPDELQAHGVLVRDDEGQHVLAAVAGGGTTRRGKRRGGKTPPVASRPIGGGISDREMPPEPSSNRQEPSNSLSPLRADRATPDDDQHQADLDELMQLVLRDLTTPCTWEQVRHRRDVLEPRISAYWDGVHPGDDDAAWAAWEDEQAAFWDRFRLLADDVHEHLRSHPMDAADPMGDAPLAPQAMELTQAMEPPVDVTATWSVVTPISSRRDRRAAKSRQREEVAA